MTSVLITGTNRGIGLALTKRYLGEGFKVHATCRKSSDSGELRALSGDLHVHHADVGDELSLKQVSEAIKDESLDILIACAGIIGSNANFEELEANQWLEVLKVNALGPAVTGRAFLGQLLKGREKKLIAITSLMGSIKDNRMGRYIPYRMSKAALNMLWHSLAIDYKGQGVITAVIHPGWVKTDMGGPDADITTETSSRGIIRVISSLKPSDSGKFLSYEGKGLPW